MRDYCFRIGNQEFLIHHNKYTCRRFEFELLDITHDIVLCSGQLDFCIRALEGHLKKAFKRFSFETLMTEEW